MTAHVIKKRLRLLQVWDWKCVLCGDFFESLHSITIEHLVPRSIARGINYNQAPSHYNCNRFRRDNSLIATIHGLTMKRQSMGRVSFRQWTNAKVPYRIVPDEFLLISTLPPRSRPQLVLPGYEFVNSNE